MQNVKIRLITRYGNMLDMEVPAPAPQTIKLPKPLKGTLHSAARLLNEKPRVLFFTLHSHDIFSDTLIYHEAEEGTDSKSFPLHDLSKVFTKGVQ